MGLLCCSVSVISGFWVPQNSKSEGDHQHEKKVILTVNFAEECAAVELKKEYTGYFDTEKYALVSVLSEKELVEKYGALLDGYRPFVVITPEMADVICEYWRNEWKHEKRMLRGSLFPVEDDFDEHHPECAGPDCLEQLLLEELSQDVQAAIERLTPIQRRRLFKWVFLGMTAREIAAEEGVTHSKIIKSLSHAREKMKKFLD